MSALFNLAVLVSSITLASQAVPPLITLTGGSLKSLGTTVFVKSKSGGKYKVQQKYKNRDIAAEKMEIVDKLAKTLISILKKDYPNDPRTLRLETNYRPDRMQEGQPDKEGDYTSYSISKGDKLVICLRSAEKESELHDQNTINFVVIHELAHLASENYGHGKEFVRNFVWLLKIAIKHNLYKYVDYHKTPVNYCGMEIDATPI